MANPLLKYVAPALGLAAGAGAGYVGAHTTGETVSPGFSQDARGAGTIGASALLGLLLGTKRGRSALGVVRPKFSPTTGVLNGSRLNLPMTAAVTAAPFTSIPAAASTPTVLKHVNQATQNAFDVSAKAKAMLANAKDDYDSVREHFDPKNLARDVGLSVGGGVAGYLGGGAVGKALGRFISPDDEQATYEQRRHKEKIRNVVEALGAMGASAIGSLVTPWAYNKYGPKTAAIIGRSRA